MGLDPLGTAMGLLAAYGALGLASAFGSTIGLTFC